MKPFSKNKHPERHAGQDQLASKIAGTIITGQQRLAAYLNGKTKHFKGKSLRLALIVYVALFGGYCLCLLMDAFN